MMDRIDGHEHYYPARPDEHSHKLGTAETALFNSFNSTLYEGYLIQKQNA